MSRSDPLANTDTPSSPPGNSHADTSQQGTYSEFYFLTPEFFLQFVKDRPPSSHQGWDKGCPIPDSFDRQLPNAGHGFPPALRWEDEKDYWRQNLNETMHHDFPGWLLGRVRVIKLPLIEAAGRFGY